MRKEKKVCFLLGGSRLSGAEKRIIVTALELSKIDGYKIKLITSDKLRREFYMSSLSDSDVKLDWVVRKKSKLKNKYLRRACNLFFNVILNIFQLPIRNGYVHVVLFDKSTLLSLILARVLGNSLFYFEVTSPDVAKSKEVEYLVKYNFLYDKIICVSHGVAQLLSNKYKIECLTRKQPLAYLKETKKEQVEKDNNIVFAHRLIERKNPIIAARVFSFLSKEHLNWNFYICGDGELKEEVESIISEGQSSNFKYLGYVYDMDGLMRKSKIFVSLIEPDNYPSQSVFNAMANGNVLIVSDTGESREKFIADNGYAVDVSFDALFDSIKRAITEDDLELMSEASIRLFESNYKIQSYVEENKNFYISRSY